MSLKKSSNSIGPCDRLLQEPITFPRKISRTFHESGQSNRANKLLKFDFFISFCCIFLQRKSHFRDVPLSSQTCYFANTVQILCFGTDRSQQTVQTKIRLLLKKQSDQGLRCLPFHQHLFDALMQRYINLFYF